MTNADHMAFPSDDFNGGLTKREYFAAMAMSGIMASVNPDVIALKDAGKATYATIMADELIEALNAEKY